MFVSTTHVHCNRQVIHTALCYDETQMLRCMQRSKKNPFLLNGYIDLGPDTRSFTSG